jgi:hypothetical protein
MMNELVVPFTKLSPNGVDFDRFEKILIDFGWWEPDITIQFYCFYSINRLDLRAFESLLPASKNKRLQLLAVTFFVYINCFAVTNAIIKTMPPGKERYHESYHTKHHHLMNMRELFNL